MPDYITKKVQEALESLGVTTLDQGIAKCNRLLNNQNEQANLPNVPDSDL